MKKEFKLKETGPVVILDDEEIDVTFFEYCYKKSNLKNSILKFYKPIDFLKYMGKVKSEQEIMPAILFLDINMPGMNGFDILKTIRSDKSISPQPIVVMLSSSTKNNDVELAKTLGGNGYQVKFDEPLPYIDFLNSLAEQ